MLLQARLVMLFLFLGMGVKANSRLHGDRKGGWPHTAYKSRARLTALLLHIRPPRPALDFSLSRELKMKGDCPFSYKI